jgi:hypothetical protein
VQCILNVFVLIAECMKTATREPVW